MMSFRDFYPEYVPVAKKREKSRQQLEKLRKKNPDLAPVLPEGRTIARTWWGKAWNKNLEIYADYTNRIARGRSYVRNGAVLDLQVEKGLVRSLVQGSVGKPYQIEIRITPLSPQQLEAILSLCRNKIDSMAELLEGKFPRKMAEIFTAKDQGLFPTAAEISFTCSCPDWAGMCKHVTAALYGIGARFDEDPVLFFKLRDMDFELLLKKTIEQKMQSMLKNAHEKSSRVLDDEEISGLFGI